MSADLTATTVIGLHKPSRIQDELAEARRVLQSAVIPWPFSHYPDCGCQGNECLRVEDDRA